VKSFSALALLPALLTLSLDGSHSYSLKNIERFKLIKSQLDELCRSAQYNRAIPLYRKAAEDARSAGLQNYRVIFLANLSNCQFATFQFRLALRTMEEARAVAKQIGDRRSIGMLDSNMSSLFWQMGNEAEASNAAEEGLSYADSFLPERRARFLGHLGTIRAKMGRLDAAEPVFGQAIDIAVKAGDPAAAAWVWDLLAYARFNARELREAEGAAKEALRLNECLHSGAIDSSYLNLGRIRAARGDLPAAITLMNMAERALYEPGSVTPAWRIYMERGRIKLQAGQLRLALDDLRTALSRARAWRLDVVANDANRTSSEGTLAGLYELLIEAGNRLYLATHDRALIRETFEAAEENRAASLRALVPERNDWRKRLPAQYYELLARLQAAESANLHGGGEQASAALLHLRSELEQMEANAGAPARDDRSRALDAAQGALDGGSALFSFQLGESGSWLWAVTKGGLSLHELPARGALKAEIEQFKGGVESKSSHTLEQGAKLYHSLFGSVEPAVLARERWLLVLDGELFDLPFQALSPRKGRYLVEDHALQVAPGALMLRAGGNQSRRRGSLLAVGDPIYNRADARATNDNRWPSLLIRANYDHAPAFARLWGTAREIQVSARTWNTPAPVLLTGRQANPDLFWTSVKNNPDIIHIATHILEENGQTKTGWIALSLGSDGEVAYITPEDILARSITARLVVLSGCSSGKAEVRTASGLMGLTRSWIAAGAGAVLATRWPTVDDDGAFFESFYRNLRSSDGTDPAKALRNASLEMFKSGTWRAEPSFWAGYFLVGNF
jgi:CHAT domain-containing protein